MSPLDPEIFSSVEEHAAELLSGDASGKYSPVEVAQFFEDACVKSARAIASAADAVPSRADPAFRRWEEDILIQVALADLSQFGCSDLAKPFRISERYPKVSTTATARRRAA